MKCIEINNGVKIENITNLELSQTLDCGQAFRWQEIDGKYQGVAFNKKVAMYMKDATLYIEGSTKTDFENIWKNYLDLDLDYEKIKNTIATLHPILKEACEYAGGIRILKQDSWEALCSFIISQNNNIKRIKGIIQSLCENFGENLGGYYSFPTAEKLATLKSDDLNIIKAGFRNKYIIDAAIKVSQSKVNLEKCKTLPYDEARSELTKIKGVGVKVADCTLLFGMHRIEAFPVDVWMKKALEKLFPTMTPADFGEYAGIAQQYIFHYSRMHPELFI